jgi:signal peptidase I
VPHPRGRGSSGPLSLPLRTAATAVAAVGFAAIAALRPGRFEVEGRSMAPTLEPGDRLLVLRALHYGIGDLVVVPDPRDGSRAFVKRIAALPGGRVSVDGLTIEAAEGECVLLGDNPQASTDSRTLGPVRMDDIAGRCVYRYHPPQRAGRLGS